MLIIDKVELLRDVQTLVNNINDELHSGIDKVYSSNQSSRYEILFRLKNISESLIVLHNFTESILNSSTDVENPLDFDSKGQTGDLPMSELLRLHNWRLMTIANHKRLVESRDNSVWGIMGYRSTANPNIVMSCEVAAQNDTTPTWFRYLTNEYEVISITRMYSFGDDVLVKVSDDDVEVESLN